MCKQIHLLYNYVMLWYIHKNVLNYNHPGPWQQMHACIHLHTFSYFYPNLLSLRILMWARDDSRSLSHFCFTVMGFSLSFSWHTMIGTHSLFTSTTALCASNMAPKAKKIKETKPLGLSIKDTLAQEQLAHETVSRVLTLVLWKRQD